MSDLVNEFINFRIINGQQFFEDGNHIYHIIQIGKKNAFLNIYHGSNIRQISDQTSRIFTRYHNIRISKVIGIKYILSTDISR